ncbi:MAG: glycosyltransferase family 2 protein [Desulfobacterota bacterium]|nr:glycosyltransferase family 2 protein [Thermodesulfobacteriota bacterium]MDW8002205.1 glycosyltransferase family 2 protein [Deltaproteobacteria bacterium]
MLSVFMITYNNAPTIERALLSVSDLKDELVVVDSHSTDGTTEIVAKYADKLYHLDTDDLRKKYQFAQDQCSFEWVLFIDADEWLTEELKQEIRETLSRKDGGFDGYIIHRRNIYLGREIKHGGWYPDREIRLYKREKGRWEGGIHAKVVVDGKIGTLRHKYMHTPYSSTSHQIHTIIRYSEAYAWDLFNSNKKFSLLKMIGRPFFRFIRDYFLKMGFLDGIPGLIIAVSTAYYVFMKQGKLWEIQNVLSQSERANYGKIRGL